MANQERVPLYDPFTGRALAPPAERTFIPSDEIETAQETVWFNPTDKDVAVQLYIGVTPCRSEAARRQFRAMNAQQKKEFRTGLRTFIFRAGFRRSLHTDFDMGIQQYVCLEAECSNNKLYCRDRGHHKMVNGGYGPQLVNESLQHRPLVHPSLNEAAALEKAAYEAAGRLLQERELAGKSAMLAYEQMESAKRQQQATADAERDARARADGESRAAQPAVDEKSAPAAQARKPHTKD